MNDRFLRVRFKIADQSNLIEHEIAKQDPPYRHSHVELQFSDDSSFSSRAIASGDGKHRNGTSFANVEYDDQHWDTISIPVTEDEEKRVHQFCIEQDGEDYDFVGVSAFKLWILHQDPNKWFCSEVVCEALKTLSILQEVVSHKTSPDALYTVLQALKL